MQIRQLKITNFRGIVSLDWKPADSFCCLIGAGDTGKSTILDAIEAALSSRWYSFMEPDFANCDTTGTIAIEVTVGELSKSLKSDERFGLYIRGWTSADDLRDEPEDGDEAVLTVRLTVDASMEPVWELVCDRVDDPRTLSNRDRTLFGLVRLAGEDARHLTWGQGSVLSRLTDDSDEAAQRLAEAYGAARKSAQLDKIEALANAAQKAESFAKSLGAYIQGNYKPGLELGRAGLSTGSIALHDDNVPLRLGERVEAMLRQAVQAPWVEDDDFLAEGFLPVPGRDSGQLALGVDDVGTPLRMQQVRDDSRNPLTRPRRGHRQAMRLARVEQHHAVERPEEQSSRVGEPGTLCLFRRHERG